jgi:hypothetical protein
MHCDDFSRTDAERRSRLAAPISRRRLLQAGLGATISLYAARAMPLTRAFEAAEASAQAAPNAPVLVNVFVPGGWTCSTRWSPATPTRATPTCARR